MSLLETIKRAKAGNADDQRKLTLLAAIVIAVVIVACLSFLNPETQTCISNQGVIRHVGSINIFDGKIHHESECMHN
jgi:hypothetical protein